MSLNDSHIRQMFGAARRMRNYPEGDDLGWAIVEGLFALGCIGTLAICALCVVS